MSFSNISGFNNFVPNDLIIPDDPVTQELVLTDYFRYIVNALNSKEIAIYDEQEIATGGVWFNSTNREVPRYAFRTVIDFGTLPNAGTTSVAHNITTTQNTVFTRIYAVSTDPAASTTNRAVPIPYVNMAAPADGIEIDVDATNVNITTTTANWINFTNTYVVLEYLQN